MEREGEGECFVVGEGVVWIRSDYTLIRTVICAIIGVVVGSFWCIVGGWIGCRGSGMKGCRGRELDQIIP